MRFKLYHSWLSRVVMHLRQEAVVRLTGGAGGPTYNAGHMRILVVLLCLLAGSAVLAGPDIAEVREAADRARAESSLASPDRPLWRTAIRLAEELRAAEPDAAEAARLLAGKYSEVGGQPRGAAAGRRGAGRRRA